MYLLPTHPSLTSNDPLGVCDGELDVVSQSDLLQRFISRAIQSAAQDDLLAIRTTIEDIAYSIHGNGRLDTGRLREVLLASSSWLEVLTATQNLLQAAQKLSNLPPIIASATPAKCGCIQAGRQSSRRSPSSHVPKDAVSTCQEWLGTSKLYHVVCGRTCAPPGCRFDPETLTVRHLAAA